MISERVAMSNRVTLRPAVSFFWKEIHEQRLIVLWSALFTVALFVWLLALDYVPFAEGGEPGLIFSGYMPALLAPYFFVAIVSGSRVIAPELSGGTLQFIASLPIKRGTIWMSKVAAAFCAFLLAAAVSQLAWQVLETIASAATFAQSMPVGSSNKSFEFTTNFALIVPSIDVFIVFIPVFCVAAVVSALVDRPLIALLISGIVTLTLWSICLTVAHSVTAYLPFVGQDLTMLLICTLSVPALLFISHQVFVHGETLQGSKRYYISIRAFALSSVVFLLAMIAAFWCIRL